MSWIGHIRNQHAIMTSQPVDGLRDGLVYEIRTASKKALSLLWARQFQAPFFPQLQHPQPGLMRWSARLYFRLKFWMRRTIKRMEREAYAARRLVLAQAVNPQSRLGLKRSRDDQLTPLHRPNGWTRIVDMTPPRGYPNLKQMDYKTHKEWNDQ